LAFGFAVLFLGMALGSKLLVGVWPFDGALELTVVCVVLGILFHVLGMRRVATSPDPSALLNQAFTVASAGSIDGAIGILSKAISENPQLWQAFQYRGELYMSVQNYSAAVSDFNRAIRLAPEERHLNDLLDRAKEQDGGASDFGTTPASHDSGGK
jgi:tetratricopeptide (TPR) repeat protein